MIVFFFQNRPIADADSFLKMPLNFKFVEQKTFHI